jgi:putative acetyltransferase
LRVDVNEGNPGALAFYRRLGFTQTGRSPLDGAGRPYPLLHLAQSAFL